MSKKKPTVQSVIQTKALNRGRKLIGLPEQSGHSWRDLLLHQVSVWWTEFTGTTPQPTRLPDDLPFSLYHTIDQTLRLRGGMTGDDPNFWCNPAHTSSTLFLWSIHIDYQPSVDPAKLANMESAIESAISRAGYPYNVRIQQRAVVIEIDKPDPPTITLRDCWPSVSGHEQNKRQALMGAYTDNGRTVYGFEKLVDQNCSAFITGKPRSGKSQAGMSLILSLAMTNSPESLSMILIDPKLIDFRPCAALPHLAMPVISDPAQAADAILMLSDEIDKRRAMVARGDKSFLRHSILIFVDELTDLFDTLDKHTEAKPNPVVVAWRRLAMVGGGYNIVVIGCTQRVFDLHIDIYSKLGLRMVGKQANAGDSAAASGRAGTTAHLLPGKGSFEIYSADEDGTRVQGAFVADSKLESYEQNLQPFFDAINERWQGIQAGWTSPGNAPRSHPDNVSPLPTEAPKSTQDKPAVDQAWIDGMTAAYRYCHQSGAEFSPSIVVNLHKRLYKKSVNFDRAKRLRDEFLQVSATEFAGH